MRTHLPRVVLLSLVLCLGTLSAWADETFRCEITQFADDLHNVRSLAIDGSMRDQLATLSSQQLDVLQSALGSIPNWQQLPAVLASVETAGEEHNKQLVGRLIASGGLVSPDAAHDPFMTDEEFRQDFLFLIGQYERFVPVMSADFGNRVAKLRKKIETMPAGAIPALRTAWAQRAADIQKAIVTSATSGEPLSQSLAKLTPISQGCDTDCGINLVCWGNAVGCLISEAADLANQIANYVSSIANFISNFFTNTIPNLINQIAQLGTQVVNWFTNVFNQISNFVTDTFNSIKGLLPQTVGDVLNYVAAKTGFDFRNAANINWASIASSIPTITPPCPTGAALDTIGQVCDAGADALTRLLFDVAPEDGLSVELKLGLAVINFPLAYLCQCRDSADAIDLADKQAAHRALTGQQLDLQLSTRATQASVNALSGSMAVLDGDVAKVEAKLDRLDATAGRIVINVNRIDQTTARTEATVNRIETNTNHIEATTNRTESKVDSLTSGNNTQQSYLADFMKLMTRLHIEENLLENKPNAISLFQLPAAFGGKLETVGLIVADTIQMNLNALQNTFGAQREISRADGLRAAGDFVKAYEAYRSAYTEAVK